MKVFSMDMVACAGPGRLLWLAGVLGLLMGPTPVWADKGVETGRIDTKMLKEISGIAASRRFSDVLWIHNDGPSQYLYAITARGKVAAQVSVPARVEDVEDVALGPGPQPDVDYIYLGDVGDNDGERRSVQAVRFAEPSVGSVGNGGPLQAESLGLVYPDGPVNAETLMIDPIDRSLLVVTKEVKGARVYAAPLDQLRPGAAARLRLAARLDGPREVSGGDVSADGRLIVLRREGEGWLWRREPGESVASALGRPPLQASVRGKKQADNGEAITFAADGQGYFTVSEGSRERIYRFALPD